MKLSGVPLRKTMCSTCPFRPGSKYANLANTLAQSAISEASRICHSTGSNNGINRRTGKPPAICRGARDLQLNVYAALGVIEAPTDEAWAKALDRWPDPNGNYEPSNTRWATKVEQAWNRRTTIWIERDGIKKPLCIWAKELGFKPQTIHSRYKSGCPVERLFER